MLNGKEKICMVVQDSMVKGGIAAVVNGYHGSYLEKDYNIIYVESYKDGGKVTKLLKGICGYIHLAKVLLFNRPDLVHIHSSFGPSFYRKIPFIYMASWAKIPIINHIHGADFDEFYANASGKKKELVRKVYGKCNKLIALSEEWKERLSQIVPTDRIVIIENYSILHEDALCDRLNRPCNNQVLFLGELGRRKGCYDIPNVVKYVAEKLPNIRFILCGSGSEADENAIKKLVYKNRVDNNVVFKGWVRDGEKDKVLREADVFFLPSYNEGMPMAILDAMGYGLPVVSTNTGGISKIVYDKKNGICCNPGDVETMAAGIIELLTDNQKRNDASKASMNIVRNGYSLESHLEKLQELYEEVIHAEAVNRRMINK
ncbi:MAG TPA: glycosyltransferase family 4 protein [Candidatus Mediterraneibacter faecavium]|uniref:Glycosyltransferase family 4 protein n=1 Tax=Candidatus Mediterraneibacter faecavium TaxID=2838668 RepID=A0A9D2TMS6_9FIRM|nr:glycosyltransferase family 4 protein [Candidatus Mediterraneibacter faecavium]